MRQHQLFVPSVDPVDAAASRSQAKAAFAHSPGELVGHGTFRVGQRVWFLDQANERWVTAIVVGPDPEAKRDTRRIEVEFEEDESYPTVAGSARRCIGNVGFFYPYIPGKLPPYLREYYHGPLEIPAYDTPAPQYYPPRVSAAGMTSELLHSVDAMIWLDADIAQNAVRIAQLDVDQVRRADGSAGVYYIAGEDGSVLTKHGFAKRIATEQRRIERHHLLKNPLR